VAFAARVLKIFKPLMASVRTGAFMSFELSGPVSILVFDAQE
jgi:hypothetical protein